MAVFYKGKRMPWFIPGLRSGEDINLDPQTFSPDLLPQGMIRVSSDMTLVRIPQIPGRISTRRDGHIELILSRTYDKEAKQSRNKKVIIGSDASGILHRMMTPNDNYYDLFDGRGRLYHDPMQEDQEEHQSTITEKPQPQNPKQDHQARKQESPAPKTQKPNTPETEAQNPKTPKPKTQSSQTEEEITDEALKKKAQELRDLEARLLQKEKALDAREQRLEAWEAELNETEAQQIFDEDDAQKDHIRILSYMLESYIDTVKPQAGKKPSQPMSLKQIRTINELLSELKAFFQGSETDSYLHLAEEPDETKNIPGTTNGEMALLLTAYNHTVSAYLYSNLRTKQ